MDRAKILILDDERSGVQHLQIALGGQHTLHFCRNIQDAIAELDKDDYNLVICGVHLLNESMFDFLHEVKRTASGRGIPFVCFRAVETKLGQMLDENIENAARALGADAYLVVETTEADAAALRSKIEEQLAPVLIKVQRSRENPR